MTERTEIDVLSELLATFRLKAQVSRHAEYCGAWSISTAGSRRATFHMVGRGECWLHRRDQEPLRLHAGDVLVFPHDAWHQLSSSRVLDGAPSAHAEVEAPTTVLCGFFDFGEHGSNPVLAELPDMILLRSEGIAGFTALETLVRLILNEAAADRSGRQAVIDKLGDVLFVMILRFYIDTAADRRGLLAALADRRLQKALAALHRRPAHPWRLDELARTAGMSRTGFASRFHAWVGSTPMQYLAAWRMRLATELLCDSRMSVAAVAEKVGYDTEAAFRRAYRRLCGVGPGSIRRTSRMQN